MFYILLLLLTSTTISYLILKLIYRKAFKSKKKISKFLTFLGSIGLIIFYYTPYSFYLEPSYWQFRNMCKLNELPNNDEKYNKILGYFDTDLERLESDWGRLIKSEWEIPNEVDYYKKGIFEYAATTNKKKINYRIYIVAEFLSNESKINRYNINQAGIDFYWHSRRYVLEKESMTSYNYIWSDNTLSCIDIGIQDNMTPKE